MVNDALNDRAEDTTEGPLPEGERPCPTFSDREDQLRNSARMFWLLEFAIESAWMPSCC
jgi:hypothetical protein